MRISRLSMMVGFAGSLALAAQLVACGGGDDDASSSSGATPSTSSGDSPGSSSGSVPPDAGPPSGPTVTVSESRAKVYLGQKAVVDGAAVAPGLTSWTVINAPFQSAITTASLQDAASASPSFTPDLLGSYTLQATGGDTTVLVFVEAIDAPIFWRSMDLTAQNDVIDSTIASYVGGAHSTQHRVVGCPETIHDAGNTYQYGYLSILAGTAGADSWEAAPGQPSRLAYPQVAVADTAIQAGLGVLTSTSTCESGDAKLIATVANDAGSGTPDLIGAIRFAPNGNRLAYVHDTPAHHTEVATIGFDGSDARELSAYFSGVDGGVDSDAGPMLTAPQTPPRWLDDTHVGFISYRSGPTGAEADWDLYVVEDAAGAVPSLLMHCDDSQVSSFEFLPDGSIAATTRHKATDVVDGDTTPMNLLIYRPNAATKQCEIVRNVTNHTKSDAVTRGLSLSPDKTRLAFLDGTGSGSISQNPTENALGVYWVKVDGSAAAERVPGAPQTGVQLAGGTRWAAGGTVLTWTEAGSATELGAGGRIVALPIGGERAVVKEGTSSQSSDDAGQILHIEVVQGAGQGCSTGPGGAPFGALALGGAVGVLGLVLRRKRK